MRIALASIHPRALSGQVESLVGLAQALEANGHWVRVVSAFPDRQLLREDRLKLASVSTRLVFDQPIRMARILRGLLHLAPAVDVIQFNLPTPAFSMYADAVQMMTRAPVVVAYEAHLVSARELLRPDRWRQSPGFYLPRLLINNRFTARLTWHRAAHYVVATQYQRKELISLGVPDERLAVIPPVLPHDKLARVPHPPVAISRPGNRLVTYVGHYNHIKGVEDLVHAFQMLAPRIPDLHLVLAWSGIGAPRRVREVLNHPALAGRVSELGQVRVLDLMAASSVVALPYRLTIGQAAQPATLVEAVAANVPVITTNLPVLRELTDEGKTALLVPPDDPAALALAIERVLKDSQLTQRMLAAQRDWVQKIQPEQVVKHFEQLYARVIAARQASVLRASPGRERV